MSAYLTDGPISITKINDSEQRVEFAQTLSAGNRLETVSVSVIIPLIPTRTIQEIHQIALDRAVQILRIPSAESPSHHE